MNHITVNRENTLTFKVQGDISLEIGDPSYYDDLGYSGCSLITHDQTYEDVKGDVFVHMDKEGKYPIAHILLKKEILPQSRVFNFELIKDFSVLNISYCGNKTEIVKQLRSDTKVYDFNGIEIYAGDGVYGNVFEYSIDGFFAGVYVKLSGPFGVGMEVEEFYQFIYEALFQWEVDES